MQYITGIQALLDLLYDGNFSVAQGMKDDFMQKEYESKWTDYCYMS